MSYVAKGDRVNVQYLKAAPLVSLAGVQLKFEATSVSFAGTIRHIRGDHPTAPMEVKFWIQPDADSSDLDAVLCEKCGVLEVGPISQCCISPIESEV